MEKGTIQGVLGAYFNERKYLKYETIKNYTTSAKDLLAFCKEQDLSLMSEFKREHSTLFVDFLKAKDNANSTIKNKLMFLRAILDYAVELELISKVNLAKVRLVDDLQEEQRKEMKPFSLDEIERLIKNAKGELRSYLIIAFFTGARMGEILGLQKDDVRLDENKVNIKKSLGENNVLETTKNKSSNRVIDLLPIVKKEFEKLVYRNKSGFLFKNSRFNLRKDFKLLQNALKIPIRRLYNTRHSFASIMISKGEESMWVSRVMLGHSTLSTTLRYYAKYIPQDISKRALFLRDLAL